LLIPEVKPDSKKVSIIENLPENSNKMEKRNSINTSVIKDQDNRADGQSKSLADIGHGKSSEMDKFNALQDKDEDEEDE
jgi:hypothetical protein